MIHRDRDTEGGLRPEAGYATSNLRILNPGRAENARPFIARDAQSVFLMTVPGGGPGGGWILETGRLAGCRGCTAPADFVRIGAGRVRRITPQGHRGGCRCAAVQCQAKGLLALGPPGIGAAGGVAQPVFTAAGLVFLRGTCPLACSAAMCTQGSRRICMSRPYTWAACCG